MTAVGPAPRIISRSIFMALPLGYVSQAMYCIVSAAKCHVNENYCRCEKIHHKSSDVLDAFKLTKGPASVVRAASLHLSQKRGGEGNVDV